MVHSMSVMHLAVPPDCYLGPMAAPVLSQARGHRNGPSSQLGAVEGGDGPGRGWILIGI